MLRQLLHALLILCLAAPAVAMPLASPERPEMAAGHCNDDMPADEPDSPRASLHGCIGCLAPIAAAPIAPEPAAVEPASYRSMHRSLTPNPRDGPDTPPPRLA